LLLSFSRTGIFVAAVLLLGASIAAAQTPGDGGPDPAAVRVRIGPLWMNPTMAVPNVGVDTNVFNEATDPKRDFTVTASPRTDLWLRMGRTWLSGNITEQIVWYQKYASERSTNDTYAIGWKAPLNRLFVTAGATWVNTRERPGFEIDARAHRTQPTYDGRVEVRAFAKTFVGVRGTWDKVSFDRTAVFQGISLQDELNRTIASEAITIRHELTPLTSVTFSGGRTEQRFETALSRNSVSDDYSVGLTFDPAALLKGAVTIGYTDFKPEAADLPGYKGTTASASLAYSLLGSTKFSASLTRDVEFSYDVEQPYYVMMGGSVSIAQQIFGPLDVVVRGGRQRLGYRTLTDAAVLSANRVDRVDSYGGGFGIHLGPDLRLGFNIDQEQRRSIVVDRRYSGLKYGTSLTYGL
jgi:hypothetical protein